jgi:hypothetical protein
MAREVEMSDAVKVPAAAAPAAATVQPQDPEKAVFAGERLVKFPMSSVENFLWA